MLGTNNPYLIFILNVHFYINVKTHIYLFSLNRPNGPIQSLNCHICLLCVVCAIGCIFSNIFFQQLFFLGMVALVPSPPSPLPPPTLSPTPPQKAQKYQYICYCHIKLPKGLCIINFWETNLKLSFNLFFKTVTP